MILEIILGILMLVMSFAIFNLVRRLDALLDEIDKMEIESMDSADRIRRAIHSMREIDSKGGFESEDEVGSVFKALLYEVEKLENNEYDDSL